MNIPFEYRNPYDFVPLENAPTLLSYAAVQALTQSRSQGYSGTITYTLTIETDLCIHDDPQVGTFAGDRNRQYVIPNTSFKGMLRSVYEAVTNSTLSIVTLNSIKFRRTEQTMRNNYRAQGWINSDIDREIRRFRKGQQRQWLEDLEPRAYFGRQAEDDAQAPADDQPSAYTAAEALFGSVGHSADAVGRAGRIFLDDIPVTGLQPYTIWFPNGPQPTPSHKPFYFVPQTQWTILGRKFYYHQDPDKASEYYRTSGAASQRRLQVVKTDTLQGALRFINLSADELAALVYTLELEDDLAHKLGFGKGVGLGSVRLHIDELKTETLAPTTLTTEPSAQDVLVPTRYWGLLSSDTPHSKHWERAEIAALRDQGRQSWVTRPLGARSYQSFREIASYRQDELLVYPTFGFFNGNRAATTPLWQYQGRQPTQIFPGGAPAPRVVPPPPSAPNKPLPPPPAKEPTVPLQQQFTDRLMQEGVIEPNAANVVRGTDERQYRLVPDSAPREVMSPLSARLKSGASCRVRFRPDKQKIEGKHRPVALDLTLLDEEPA